MENTTIMYFTLALVSRSSFIIISLIICAVRNEMILN